MSEENNKDSELGFFASLKEALFGNIVPDSVTTKDFTDKYLEIQNNLTELSEYIKELYNKSKNSDDNDYERCQTYAYLEEIENALVDFFEED